MSEGGRTMDNRPGWKGGGREEGGVKGEVWVGGGGIKVYKLFNKRKHVW